MGRTMPTECEHGAVIDWGDFGPEDDDALPECPECEREKCSGRRFVLVSRSEGPTAMCVRPDAIDAFWTSGDGTWIKFANGDYKHLSTPFDDVREALV